MVLKDYNISHNKIMFINSFIFTTDISSINLSHFSIFLQRLFQSWQISTVIYSWVVSKKLIDNSTKPLQVWDKQFPVSFVKHLTLLPLLFVISLEKLLMSIGFANFYHLDYEWQLSSNLANEYLHMRYGYLQFSRIQ